MSAIELDELSGDVADLIDYRRRGDAFAPRDPIGEAYIAITCTRRPWGGEAARGLFAFDTDRAKLDIDVEAMLADIPLPDMPFPWRARYHGTVRRPEPLPDHSWIQFEQPFDARRLALIILAVAVSVAWTTLLLLYLFGVIDADMATRTEVR